MARAAGIASRVESLLGTAVVATSPVAGGDICTATRIRLADGSSAMVKTRPRAPADFFRAEARGLRWLEAAAGAAVPEVLAVADDCLVLRWVETGRPGGEAAEAFGRALATTHAAGADHFGGPAGYIGILPFPAAEVATWPEFFAAERVLPFLRLARDRGGISETDAAAVEHLAGRIDQVAGPAEPPARLHGDLWGGNVLWGSDGRIRLVDPAAHGGHRESDLAMLALFGLPQLDRVLGGYQAVAPLADGWEERVALHQLYPLLVHAAMFGGSSYGARAGQASRALA